MATERQAAGRVTPLLPPPVTTTDFYIAALLAEIRELGDTLRAHFVPAAPNGEVVELRERQRKRS